MELILLLRKGDRDLEIEMLVALPLTYVCLFRVSFLSKMTPRCLVSLNQAIVTLLMVIRLG